VVYLFTGNTTDLDISFYLGSLLGPCKSRLGLSIDYSLKNVPGTSDAAGMFRIPKILQGGARCCFTAGKYRTSTEADLGQRGRLKARQFLYISQLYWERPLFTFPSPARTLAYPLVETYCKFGSSNSPPRVFCSGWIIRSVNWTAQNRVIEVKLRPKWSYVKLVRLSKVRLS